MPSIVSTFCANFMLELRLTLRRPTVYIATALLFTYWSIFSSRLNMDPNFWGPKGGVFANAPVVIYFIFATQAFVTFLFVPLIMGNGPLREQKASLTHAWLATPMRPVVALWGRYWAAFFVLALGTLIASSGVLLSPYLRMALGKTQGLSFGPVPYLHVLHAWSFIILPTLFFASSFVFWLVVHFRRASAAIAATLILVLGAVISHYFGKTMHFDALWLVDPTAFHAVHRSVSYWTIEQRNHALLPLTDLFLANRAIWLGVGLLVSMAVSRSFKTERYAQSPGPTRATKPPAHLHDQASVPPTTKEATPLRLTPQKIRAAQLAIRLRTELKRLGTEPLFNAILIVFLLWLLGQNLGALELEFVKAPAQANLLMTARRGLWMLVFYFVPYVTASTIFFERDMPGGEYLDALPVPDWVQWLPKIMALALYCALFPLLVLLASLLTQFGYAEMSFDWGAYAQILTTSYYPHLLQFVFASFAISLLCPSRAVAYAATMLALYASIFGYETANLDSELGLQMYEAMLVWSPFDGLGAYAEKALFKSLFWLSVSTLWLVLATAFWKRGQRKRRPKSASPLRVGCALLLVVASLLSARFVHQQNLAWERSRLRPNSDLARARYERALAQFRDIPSPKFGPIELNLQLEPDKASYRYDWRAPLAAGSLPLNSKLFVQTPTYDQTTVRRDTTPLEPTHSFPEFGAEIFSLDGSSIVQDAEQISVQSSHRFSGQPKKRKRPLGVLENGSYLSQNALPRFEYAPEVKLDTDLIRSAFQLSPRQGRAPAEEATQRDCPWSHQRGSWKTTLSTSTDQIAVAPGKLVQSWEKDGRSFAQYQSEHADCSFFAFASARYQTRSVNWDITPQNNINARVLYLKGSEDQAEQIEAIARRALTRLSKILGPYPYSSLQIVQVRNDADLGIAPANTLFLREHEAWSLRLEAPEDEHQRLYYISFRLTQHWLHNQLAPANTAGKGFFTQAMPAFLAHAWLEELFGEAWLSRKYLHRAMRRYFWYHGTHTATERPVIASPSIEHIHDYKGALALRAFAHLHGPEPIYQQLRSLLANKNAKRSPQADS